MPFFIFFLSSVIPPTRLFFISRPSLFLVLKKMWNGRLVYRVSLLLQAHIRESQLGCFFLSFSSPVFFFSTPILHGANSENLLWLCCVHRSLTWFFFFLLFLFLLLCVCVWVHDRSVELGEKLQLLLVFLLFISGVLTMIATGVLWAVVRVFIANKEGCKGSGRE